MKHFQIISFVFCCMIINHAHAQFVEQGEIEYEVKTNMKKSMGNSPWAEMMKDKMPDFKTLYFKMNFGGGQTEYQYLRWDNKEAFPSMMNQGDDKSAWFADHQTGKLQMTKEVFGSPFNITDSLPSIEWKLSNENRIIAGYNCRKAVGKIMDSVYVFAFYTDEITTPGGPCSVGGLPGMILGMTIPRLYTSWIAVKVTPSESNKLTRPEFPKGNAFTMQSAVATMREKTKDWMDPNDPESAMWIRMMVWTLQL